MSYQKDLKTFEDLYKEHFIFLSLVSFQITKDKDIAKDIVQDFFVYLWEKEEVLNISKSFKAYGAKAVKNLSLQHIEKSKKITLENEKLPITAYEEPVLFEKTENDNKSNIHTLVDKIPQARREIFVSHVVEGLSYAEIAETYNISVNTVKTQMKRAYAFLREYENSSSLITVLYFLGSVSLTV